jgi:hypothetical protein
MSNYFLIFRVEMFFRKLGVIKFFFNYPNFYMAACITLAIIMNFFILLGYSILDEDGEDLDLNNINLFFVLDYKSKILAKISI